MSTDVDIFREVKDYLQNYPKEKEKTKGPPVGAKPAGWAFWLTPGPNDSFNDVYPGIILGDYEAAKDKEKLRKLGVTHIVNCAQGTKFNQIDTDENYFADSGIKFYGIKASNVITYKMTPQFRPAADFMDEGLKSGGRIYIHCRRGVSRSASIVLGYLMLKQNLTLMDAVQTVRAKREINPNDGFLKQLSALHCEIHNAA